MIEKNVSVLVNSLIIMKLNIKATMSVRTSNIYTLNSVLCVCWEISGYIHVALIGLSWHGEISITTSFQVVKLAHDRNSQLNENLC